MLAKLGNQLGIAVAEGGKLGTIDGRLVLEKLGSWLGAQEGGTLGGTEGSPVMAKLGKRLGMAVAVG